MSSSMSSGWLTCRVCCSSAKYDGGGADRMRAECSNEKCPKLQVVKPSEASPENLEWAKRRKEVAASIDAELMRRFKRAACGGE